LPIYVCQICGRRIEETEEYEEDQFGRRRHKSCATRPQKQKFISIHGARKLGLDWETAVF